MNRAATLFALALLLSVCTTAQAQILLRDDVQRSVHRKAPATRIVTLAPYLTEMVYAAGAGNRLVGVSPESDYPPEAKKLPEVPMTEGFSLVKILELKPDLVLATPDDLDPVNVERLTAAGLTVFILDERRLEDVPRTLKAIGSLTGLDTTEAVATYERRLDELRSANANKARVNVFLEIWSKPLRTVTGTHFLSQALDICRADTIFKTLRWPVLRVSWEEVAARNPHGIVGMGSTGTDEEFRSNWSLRPMTAVREGRLAFLPAETTRYPTTRTPGEIARLCAAVDSIRERVSAGSGRPP